MTKWETLTAEEVQAYEDTIESLRAEVTKLRADAERFEAERNTAVIMLSSCPAYNDKHPYEVLTIVIDAARGAT